MTWHSAAACKGDPLYERWFRMTAQDIRDMQDICALCPARPGCGNEAMKDEGDVDSASRHGFRAYMTPVQRAQIHKNGGLRGRDPMLVVKGMAKQKKR